ncbi:DNL zinc finger protein [Emiliania huxleyi CCMP1516]|uniref:DNL-type domain-containing protein n=2 Tax=Emiliania huxleyi TaxID=2903 RepID=A0A0D3KWN7_EMIH1|nr:DNL zinc finger protein [Emiliania huxleyi CCMP1516]EOD40172.1 DNL zinc finger protein [Emiliania huxleyi CCMP1516]|eukprot:XP_005792601.1 DNL zinc finger protein [Emiliania huxleyi CCMP1516]
MLLFFLAQGCAFALRPLLPAPAAAPRAHAAVLLARGFGESPPAPPSRPQKKPKAKTDRFELQFTCNKCDTRNTHQISRLAYGEGTVIVTCPGCGVNHLVADNLNWIEDDFRNLKEAMQQRGKPVSDLRVETASDAQRAAAEAAPPAPAPEREAERSVAPLDGISEDQAQRIRDAVRASKQRRAADKARARAEASEAPSESGG